MGNQHFSLDQLQAWMQASLVRPTDAELNRQHQIPEIQSIEEMIKPSKRMSARDRLHIYQRGYFARLLECMSKQFSVLEYALGEALFRDFSYAYLQRYPSNSFTLSDLGTRFPDFLEATRPDHHAPPEERESWPDFMIELARIEWACFKLLERDGLRKGGAVKRRGQVICYLPPAIELFQLKFPSYPYYQAVLNRQQPDFPVPHANYLILINRNHRLGAFDLNPSQFDLLNRLRRQQDLDMAIPAMASDRGCSLQSLEQNWEQWQEYWLKWGMLIPLEA